MNLGQHTSLGSRGFTPVAAQLGDRGFQRRRRERYVIGKRGLLYRDEEIETEQVENIEFLLFIFFFKYSNDEHYN